jgi:hypothetical protein
MHWGSPFLRAPPAYPIQKTCQLWGCCKTKAGHPTARQAHTTLPEWAPRECSAAYYTALIWTSRDLIDATEHGCLSSEKSQPKPCAAFVALLCAWILVDFIFKARKGLLIVCYLWQRAAIRYYACNMAVIPLTWLLSTDFLNETLVGVHSLCAHKLIAPPLCHEYIPEHRVILSNHDCKLRHIWLGHSLE